MSRTSMTVRVSEEEKEVFRQICDLAGISMQEMMKSFIDEVIQNEERIKEEYEPPREQILRITGFKNERGGMP